MRVRATALGYYGDIRRKEGDVFDLVARTVGDKEKRRNLTVEQQFSETWMERIDEDGRPIKSVKKSEPEQKEEVEVETPRVMDRSVVEESKPEKEKVQPKHHTATKGHPAKRR